MCTAMGDRELHCIFIQITSYCCLLWLPSFVCFSRKTTKAAVTPQCEFYRREEFIIRTAKAKQENRFAEDAPIFGKISDTYLGSLQMTWNFEFATNSKLQRIHSCNFPTSRCDKPLPHFHPFRFRWTLKHFTSLLRNVWTWSNATHRPLTACNSVEKCKTNEKTWKITYIYSAKILDSESQLAFCFPKIYATTSLRKGIDLRLRWISELRIAKIHSIQMLDMKIHSIQMLDTCLALWTHFREFHRISSCESCIECS